MTHLADPPKESFKLSMLLYDTRYRSMTIQIIALIGFMIVIGWLVNNTLQNLNRDPSFGFLGQTSNYDIGQHLIDYDSQQTHGRATIVGILNTLLVAVLGCITATVLGVFVGVLRLSHNWLVSRIMTIYVETFRNVPVLLWIVFTMAIIIETLPEPKDFRGEDGVAMSMFDSVAFTNQGIFVPRLMGADMSTLLILVVAASIAGLVAINKRARRIQNQTGERPHTLGWNIAVMVVPFVVAFAGLSMFSNARSQSFIASAPAEVTSVEMLAESGRIDFCHAAGSASSLNALRYFEENEITIRRKEFFNETAAERNFVGANCALLVVDSNDAEDTLARLSAQMGEGTSLHIYDAGFSEGRAIEVEYPVMAESGIPKFTGGAILRNPLLALWIALSLYTAAFIAEIVRAGIMSVSKGQSEAAGALGLRPGKTMQLVILPQALRVIIPPLISQFLNLTKNSSLALAVGYMDIAGTLMNITRNQTGRELETVLLGMLIYLSISLSISMVMNWYNKSQQLVER